MIPKIRYKRSAATGYTHRSHSIVGNAGSSRGENNLHHAWYNTKIRCKRSAVIGCTHGGINRRKAGFSWRPNTLHHARAGCQKSEANDLRLPGARMTASIAGKPVSRGGQTPCITPGQDAKNRVQTICGYQVHTWRHQSPESRFLVAAKHPASCPGRMPEIGSKRSASTGYTYGGRQSSGKPVPVAVINFLHLHIHSYPGMVRAAMELHVPSSAGADTREYPCYSRQHQHKTFIIGDFRKALVFAVTINKKGGFKWEK